MSAILLLVVMGGLWAALIMPQQRRMKAQRALLASLDEGDLVLTTSGVYGVITELTPTDVYVEVAQGIELKMTRASIAGKVKVADDEAPAAAETDERPKGFLAKAASIAKGPTKAQ